MEFSLEALHRMDADLEAVLKSIGSLDQVALKGKNKDILVGFVQNLAGTVNKSQSMLKSAAAKIDELKSDTLKNQKSLISLQKELIQKKVRAAEIRGDDGERRDQDLGRSCDEELQQHQHGYSQEDKGGGEGGSYCRRSITQHRDLWGY